MSQINEFMQCLQQAKPPHHCVNPYRAGSAANAARCHNLQLYLADLQQRHPTHLLIGEAPGYRGCRLSGVPFVSPFILLNGVPGCGLFGLEQGYLLPDDVTAVAKEASATILWQTIATCQPTPLLWNAFPFHPHQPGRLNSNRKPNKAELALGAQFLEPFLRLFQQPICVAIGKKAQQVLNSLGRPHQIVKHPSYGGKAQFSQGLQDLL
jgi:uracil-DNA glycosylase